LAESRRVTFERSRAFENCHDPTPRGLGEPGFQGPLCGEFVDGERFFKLSKPLVYQSTKGWLTRDGGAVQLFVVEAGFVCDLESIPRWAMPFTASAKSGTLHDCLYQTGLLYREEADGVYHEALGFQRVADWRRRLRWCGVRVGGWHAWRRYRADDPRLMSHGGADL
jgi:hypothetical protein